MNLFTVYFEKACLWDLITSLPSKPMWTRDLQQRLTALQGTVIYSTQCCERRGLKAGISIKRKQNQPSNQPNKHFL